MADNKRPSSAKRAPEEEKKPAHGFSNEDRDRLLEAFDCFDRNDDQVIDKYELKDILDAVSENETVYDLEQV